MSEIKTRLAEKLSNILSLISPIRWLRHTYVLNPVIDYHKTMSSIKWFHVEIDGNEVYILQPPDKSCYTIEHGLFDINLLANNNDCTLYVQHRNYHLGVERTFFSWVSDLILKNTHKWVLLNKNYGLDPINQPANHLHTLYIPQKIYHDDELYIWLDGGSAADVIKMTLRIKEEPILSEKRGLI